MDKKQTTWIQSRLTGGCVFTVFIFKTKNPDELYVMRTSGNVGWSTMPLAMRRPAELVKNILSEEDWMRLELIATEEEPLTKELTEDEFLKLNPSPGC